MPAAPATTGSSPRRLADTKAVTPIETYPDAVRGGYFEFVFRYDPDHAGGWPVGAFSHAARAEGVPVAVDRYIRQGQQACLLDEAPLFTSSTSPRSAGTSAGRRAAGLSTVPVPPRRAAKQLEDRLLTLPPFTDVSPGFLRQCAAALKKVADGASRIHDPRTGTDTPLVEPSYTFVRNRATVRRGTPCRGVAHVHPAPGGTLNFHHQVRRPPSPT